jgi:xylulokinase
VTSVDASSSYLGIDLGTSGLKLTLIGASGAVLGEAEESYEVRAPAPGYAESRPTDWANALARAGGRLLASLSNGAPRLSAVGVTGQMHGLVLADQHGAPVRPAMLWPDQRAAVILPQWRALPAGVRDRLSNPLVAGMSGPLLTWLREHEPASVEKAALVTTPKDWLRGQLTGDRSGERSDASATLLWDVPADWWLPEALDLAGISSELLPTLVPSDAVVGPVDRPVDGDMTLNGLPVVAGAGDTAAALTALKAAECADSWDNAIVVNLGTGIQVLQPDASAHPRTNPHSHLYADADAGWYEMLAIQNGGLALSWVQEVLGVSWGDFLELAQAGAEPGEALFLPFLTGERGAIASATPTAGWQQLTSSTGRSELARSAFEALAFTVRHGIELLGQDRQQILLSGGGAREPWVRQLIADVLEQPVHYVPLRSASAVGAAVLAARGVGVRLPVPTELVEVQPTLAAKELDRAYARWLEALSFDGEH